MAEEKTPQAPPSIPEGVSPDAVERALEAARMGVDTALMVRTAAAENGLRDYLLALLQDDPTARYDPRFGVVTWTFAKDGGDLFVTCSHQAAKNAHVRRHPRLDRTLEIANARGSK